MLHLFRRILREGPQGGKRPCRVERATSARGAGVAPGRAGRGGSDGGAAWKPASFRGKSWLRRRAMYHVKPIHAWCKCYRFAAECYTPAPAGAPSPRHPWTPSAPCARTRSREAKASHRGRADQSLRPIEQRRKPLTRGSGSRIAPRERHGVGTVARVDQRIVGGLDPIGELARQEQQRFLRLGAVRRRLVDGQYAW